jgi:hypothetical protein
MKTSLTYLKNHLVCFGAAALLLMSACAAKAQILLTINDSDASAVTITATGTGPLTTTSQLFNNGVDLLGFFTTGEGFTPYTVTSTSLTTGDGSSGPVYDTAVADNISLSNVDLTLYSSSSDATETFTAGDSAFAGTLTVDLNGAGLPTAGTSGVIVTGYSGGGPNVVIGEWQVAPAVSTPEPSTWILLTGGLCFVAIVRRRVLTT